MARPDPWGNYHDTIHRDPEHSRAARTIKREVASPEETEVAIQIWKYEQQLEKFCRRRKWRRCVLALGGVAVTVWWVI